jgi:hypothetical protein
MLKGTKCVKFRFSYFHVVILKTTIMDTAQLASYVFL